ncbi:MAG: hypothetical protein ACE5FO_10255 [Parvularculaceae bacterium]
MTKLRVARTAFAILFLAVTYLTLAPNPDESAPGFAAARWLAAALFGDEMLGDKVAHFSAYGALGASAFLAAIRPFGRVWLAPIALAAYGALLEGAQGLGGVRTPELADAISNAGGALAGFVLAMLAVRFAAKGTPT